MKFIFPKDLLSQHAVVLGKTGAGKSSALRYIVEHLLDDKKRVCIIDPKGDFWGLKTSADGKHPGYPIIAFGDFKNEKASDVPINAQSGKYVAELVATGNRPCIIGFRGWMTSHMVQFWIDFASTLFNLNQGELFLVGDEFHHFAPKGKIMDPQAGKCLHWSNRLLSEGRGLGIVCLLASQRPQKVHNDTLTSCETLIAMRVVHAADRAAVEDWIKGAGTKAKGIVLLDSLASMPRGEAFVWSPEIGFGPQRVTFPMFKTFDSFAPPQLQKKVSNAGWADVDLDEVKSKLATVIEEAKQNDPKALRSELEKLRRELAQRARSAPSNPNVQVAEKTVKARDLARFKKVSEEAMKFVTTISTQDFEGLSAEEIKSAIQSGVDGIARRLEQEFLGKMQEFERLRKDAGHTLHRMKKILEADIPISIAVKHNEKFTVTQTKTPSSNITYSESTDPASRSSGLRRILIALAQRPNGLTKKQVGVRAGLSSKSGTFGTYVSTARKSGWIVDSNDRMQVTREGIEYLGDFAPLPEGDQLYRYWLGQLGNSGAARILQAAHDAYPNPLTKEQIAESAGMAQSGTFGTYLSTLRRLELIEGKSEIRASAELF